MGLWHLWTFSNWLPLLPPPRVSQMAEIADGYVGSATHSGEKTKGDKSYLRQIKPPVVCPEPALLLWGTGGLSGQGTLWGCWSPRADRMRKGDGGGGGGVVLTNTKSPPFQFTNTYARVLRRCPLAIAQRLVHCAIIAVSTAVLGRVTRTMSAALLLRNNSKRKKSNFRSPAPPPCSWSLPG